MKQRISWFVSILNQVIEISRTKNILCNKQLSTIRLQRLRALECPVILVLQVLQTQNPRSKTPWGWVSHPYLNRNARATGYHSIWKSRISQPHRPEKSVFFSRAMPWRIRNSCLQGPILCKKTPEAAWFLEQILNSPQNCWPIMIKTSAHEAMNDPISPWTLNFLLVVSTSSRKSWQDRLLDSALSLQSLVTPIPGIQENIPCASDSASLCSLSSLQESPEIGFGPASTWFKAEDSDFLVQNPGRVAGNLAEGRAMHLLLNQNWRSLSEKSKVAKSEPSIIYVHNVQNDFH